MRYSDDIPYEQRRFWYFTTHGVGPGMIPSGVKVLETREGKNDKGTLGDYICLDSILNTDELKTYDLRELSPDDEKDEIEAITEYLREAGYHGSINLGRDGVGCMEIEVTWGDWKHEHIWLKNLMKEFGYEHIREDVTEEDGGDTYSAIHTFEKIKD